MMKRKIFFIMLLFIGIASSVQVQKEEAVVLGASYIDRFKNIEGASINSNVWEAKM